MTVIRQSHVKSGGTWHGQDNHRQHLATHQVNIAKDASKCTLHDHLAGKVLVVHGFCSLFQWFAENLKGPTQVLAVADKLSWLSLQAAYHFVDGSISSSDADTPSASSRTGFAEMQSALLHMQPGRDNEHHQHSWTLAVLSACRFLHGSHALLTHTAESYHLPDQVMSAIDQHPWWTSLHASI